MTVLTYLPDSMPTLSLPQICPYLRCREEDLAPEHLEQIARILAQAEIVMDPKLCYIQLPLHLEEGRVALGEALHIQSRSLAAHLQNCTSCILFCATIGPGIERKLAANRTRPATAAVWDAVGTAGVEALCDQFCRELSPDGPYRFSPGYGDLPLSLQMKLAELLETHRRIGVSVTDSLLMTPMKSVTAFLGVRT